MMGQKKLFDRYPLNANQCLISNVFLTYPFYLVAVFFPNLAWLGFGQVLAGMLQFPAHAIVMNIRLKSIYNPGVFSATFLQIPIGIYYIWYVTVNNLAGPADFAIGSAVGVLGLVVLFGLPIALMRDKNSRYPFEPDEWYGFAEAKVRRILGAG